MISCLILAAGSSSRLGGPKQLLELGGKPMLQHVMDAALASVVNEVVVVLGHMAREIATAAPPRGPIRLTVNRDHAQGQSTSLRTGLRALSRESEAVVVLLGDQPAIRVDAIDAVVDEWRRSRARVVQTSYEGVIAHPTLLARSTWAEVEEVAGDRGARDAILEHPDWLGFVELQGPPPADIDTQEDYQRLRAAFEG